MSPDDERTHDGQHEAGLDEAQERVSRLLAAASPEQTMPADLAERLDAALAGLVEERGEAPLAQHEPGPVPSDEVTGVTELGSRRRRWGPRLLLAAAAVSVLALGAGVGLDELTGAGEETVTAEAGDAGAMSEHESPPDAAEPGESAAGSAPFAMDSDRRSSVTSGFGRPVRVRSASLSADVQRVEDAGVAVAVADSRRAWVSACVRPTTSPGDEWVPARFDGEAGVLVLRAPRDGRRTAEVFTCDDARSPAASTTVDAR